MKRKQVRLLTREPRLTFFDLPESGLRSELIAKDEVRIIDGNGTIVAQRMNPRATFRGLARLTWDALDFTYFAGYALWNYLTTPFLLVYKRRSRGSSRSARWPVTASRHIPRRNSHALAPADFLFRQPPKAAAARLRCRHCEPPCARCAFLRRVQNVRRPRGADAPPGVPAADRQCSAAGTDAGGDRHSQHRMESTMNEPSIGVSVGRVASDDAR